MDGLSLAASIIAVIQLSGSCLKLSRKFLGPSEFSSSDLTSMTTALYGFTGAAKAFQTCLEIHEDDEARLCSFEYLKPAVGSCKEALDVIKDFVERSSFIGKHIIGPKFDRKLKMSLKALDGAKDLFMMALHSDQQLHDLDSDGRTALQSAAEKGKDEIVRLLLREGCDFDHFDLMERTVLHDAVERRGNDKVMQLLLEEGVDVTIKEDYGRTALHRAVWKAGEAVVRILLDNGADVSAYDEDGRTVLDETMAVLEGVEAIAKLLQETRTDMSSWDDEERTALHNALGEGKEAVVRLLLSKGADVNVRDFKGRTPLHNPVEMLKGVNLILWHLGEKARQTDPQGLEEEWLLCELDALQKRIEEVENKTINCPSSKS